MFWRVGQVSWPIGQRILEMKLATFLGVKSMKALGNLKVTGQILKMANSVANRVFIQQI